MSKPAVRNEKGQYVKGGSPGRTPGTTDKLSQVQRAQAREEFGQLWPVARSKIVRHISHHREEEAPVECATCRHYITIIVEYTFGKPTQPVDVRELAGKMAAVLGMEDPNAVEEVLEMEQRLRLVK